MATILLQAAGSFVGGYLGTAGAAIGSAAGAMAGYMIDRAIINGTQRYEGPRLGAMRPFLAEEGISIPRIYGTVRTGGSLIWATRFEEDSETSRQGGKGGPRVTTYSYFANAAFALGEGEITGVRRIWADGREIDQEQFEIRAYRGTEDQLADPLVEAKQGADNVPAYRGIAYVVFERFPLAEYGNRLPQFQFEVIRAVDPLNTRITSVAMIPGSTEYGLSPTTVTFTPTPGETVVLNRQVLHASSDLNASLDELQSLCPNLKDIAMVVTWFGDDLRAEHCRIRPCVTFNNPDGLSQEWRVSSTLRPDAPLISRIGESSAYGGTPSDRSVIDAIAEIRRRGLKVTLYPFVMMDVPADNDLPDPFGGDAQAPYPWRGRITCHPAPGRESSPDKTTGARSAIAAFAGNAQSSDFSAGDHTVEFAGVSTDWGFRRLVLHYAHLAALAGGVDAFLLGSEMRGVTALRDEVSAFPFVEQLCDLAAQVRDILPETKLSYGADWTEYFGHQPADGSEDVFYHLDALWAHEAIDAVGIDNYMPLSDWRDGDYAGRNPDGFSAPYDLQGLRENVHRGEGYDWYYANEAARVARERSPIGDGAYSKPWVFRYKDLRSWWENAHIERIGGLETGEPTAWIPRSKPIWMTEIGCPAIDKGPNQPNVFPDPKSSENASPYFSSRGRSDIAQLRYLEAQFDAWTPGSTGFHEERNPVAALPGGRMVDPDRIYVWSWDARPFPAYPRRNDLWADGANWFLGHWMNGRLSGISTAALIRQIFADHGLPAPDCAQVDGTMAGYLVDSPTTARASLEPLLELFGIDAFEQGATIGFRDRSRTSAEVLEVMDFAVDEDRPIIETVRSPSADLPGEAELSFRDPFTDYQGALVRSEWPAKIGHGRTTINFPGLLEEGEARALLDEWLQRQWTGRQTISFATSTLEQEIGPGSLVGIPVAHGDAIFRVEKIEQGLVRRVVARSNGQRNPVPWRPQLSASSALVAPAIPGPPLCVWMDLPTLPGDQPAETHLRVAARARPWRQQVLFASAANDGFGERARINQRGALGRLLTSTGSSFSGRLDQSKAIDVELLDGAFSSVSTRDLTNGANRAAVQVDDGRWEVLQFATADEYAPGKWTLSNCLRGQCGTEDEAAVGASAGAWFVVLDGTVLPAGLQAAEIGLLRNWRCAPAGYDLSEAHASSTSLAGGLASLQPLSPVHLKAEREATGDIRISWIRRGRINADNWLAADIPLGEANERYRLTLTRPDESVVRIVESTEPHWTYTHELWTAELDDELHIAVAQLSEAVGAGKQARMVLAL